MFAQVTAENVGGVFWDNIVSRNQFNRLNVVMTVDWNLYQMKGDLYCRFNYAWLYMYFFGNFKSLRDQT